MLRRCLVGVAVVPARDLQARREAFDVPLPRPGQGLVEVVDVEHQPAFRGGEQAEVRQMGIPADLGDQPVRGVPARSAAIGSAAPRKNVNAETAIRP